MQKEVTQRTSWKVGELAGRTGVSVRTLHHYDEIGLLSPLSRTEAGHRLYSAEDVLRLQRIRSLRSLGFGLEEIRDLLEGQSLSTREVIELHISGLKEQLRKQQQLLGLLEAVAIRLGPAEEVSAGELVDTAMEVIEMSERLDRHYTGEQREYLEQRKRELGEEEIRAVEEEWPKLIERVRVEMESGTAPSDERVQRLAKRWMELVGKFTGGDPGIERSLGDMWRQEETIHGMETAPVRDMMDYISEALEVSGKAEQDRE